MTVTAISAATAIRLPPTSITSAIGLLCATKNGLSGTFAIVLPASSRNSETPIGMAKTRTYAVAAIVRGHRPSRRPVGNARSRWTTTAAQTAPRTMPMP